MALGLSFIRCTNAKINVLVSFQNGFFYVHIRCLFLHKDECQDQIPYYVRQYQ